VDEEKRRVNRRAVNEGKGGRIEGEWMSEKGGRIKGEWMRGKGGRIEGDRMRNCSG
jgi:hypothetical protein